MKNKCFGSINEEKKAFYLVNNKVANTTICNALGKHGFTGRKLVKINPNDFYIFTFVRNPFDRVLSRYTHLQRIAKDLKEENMKVAEDRLSGIELGKKTKIKHIHLGTLELKLIASYLNLNDEQKTSDFFQEFTSVSFADFTKFIINEFGVQNEPHYETQTDKFERQVITLDNINYIGRYENLQEDFNSVLEKLNLPKTTLGHANKSKSSSKHYSEFYDDETRQIVEAEYSKDLLNFGYNFESK